MKKAKLFTHTDLDGVVSNILMCHYVNLLGYSYSTELCSYDDIDKEIMGYLNSYDYDHSSLIIITDICPSIEVVDRLDSLTNDKILIDHHQTAEEVVKECSYDWLHVSEGDSGAMLCYKYLKGRFNELDNLLKHYQHLVLVTDLWDSKPRTSEAYLRYKDDIYNTLALFSALGFNNFKTRFLKDPALIFSDYERGAVDAIERIKKATCRGIYLYKFITECGGDRVVYGFCFVGRFKSEVAEYQFLTNNDLDIIFMIDMNFTNGSIRRKNESSIDLANLAEQFGGGGHPYASGFSFEIGNYSKVISRIVSKDFKLKYEEEGVR